MITVYRHVLPVPVVGVTRYVPTEAILDCPIDPCEDIPDAQTLPVRIPAALNLVGGGGGAPHEVLGEEIVEEILLQGRCQWHRAGGLCGASLSSRNVMMMSWDRVTQQTDSLSIKERWGNKKWDKAKMLGERRWTGKSGQKAWSEVSQEWHPNSSGKLCKVRMVDDGGSGVWAEHLLGWDVCDWVVRQWPGMRRGQSTAWQQQPPLPAQGSQPQLPDPTLANVCPSSVPSQPDIWQHRYHLGPNFCKSREAYQWVPPINPNWNLMSVIK